MQIRPLEKFPIVYRIADPSDAATYYVRSVVRNSVTGAIIKVNNQNFVNLVRDTTDTRRFAQSIQAPNDPSGEGFWIDVTTKVYTDSGYTIQSTDYLEKNDNYLVLERWTIQHGGGGGWGDWSSKLKDVIDYGRIEKVFNDHTANLPPTPIQLDRYDEVMSHIDLRNEEVRRAISNIELPKYTPPDLDSQSTKIIKSISSEIKNNQIDLAPHTSKVIEEVRGLKSDLRDLLGPTLDKKIQSVHTTLSEIKSSLPKDMYQSLIGNLIQEIKSTLNNQEDQTKTRIKKLL